MDCGVVAVGVSGGARGCRVGIFDSRLLDAWRARKARPALGWVGSDSFLYGGGGSMRGGSNLLYCIFDFFLKYMILTYCAGYVVGLAVSR